MKRMRGWMLVACLVAAGIGSGCSRESLRNRHLERAERFFGKERYAEAVVEYIGVLQIEPTNGLAIRNLGLSYLMSGDAWRAYPLLRTAAKLEPDNLDVKTKLAGILVAGGATDEARALAGDVLSRQADNLEALLVLAATSTSREEVDADFALLEKAAPTHAKTPTYVIALAMLMARRGDVAGAARALDEAIALAPISPDGYLARADLHRSQGNTEAARSDYEKAYSLSPAASIAGIRWALFLRGSGDQAAARSLLEQMAKESPKYLPAHVELASIQIAEGRHEEALESLEKAIALQPDHLPSLLLRSRAQVLLGRIDAARDELEAVVAQYPGAAPVRVAYARLLLREGRAADAEEQLRQALKTSPGHGEAAVALAEIELRGGRQSEAIVHLLPFTAPSSPVRPAALLLMGAARRLNGEWDAALTAYAELSSLRPTSPEPHFLAALTLQAAGRPDDAAKALEKALEVDPSFVAALAGLVAYDVDRSQIELAAERVARQIARVPESAGLRYLEASVAARANRLDDAETSLRKALELDPGMSAAYVELARLYVRQGRTDAAMQRLGEAIAAKPGDPASLMMLATLHEQQGEAEDALALYERIIEGNPTFVAALNNLAYGLAIRGRDLDKALDLAQRAHDLAPMDPYVTDTLGVVALKRKDYRWAVALLEESAGRLGSVPEVRYHLAQARLGVGQEDAARDALEEALSSDRDFPGRDEARVLAEVLQADAVKTGPEAEAKLEQAAARLPGNPSVLVRLASLREEQGRVAEAKALNEEALASSPFFVPALVNLVRLSAGDPEQAVALGRRARELAPRNPEVAHALGWAAYAAGDFPWARSLLQEAATEMPSNAVLRFRLACASLMVGRVAEGRDSLLAAVAAAESGAMAEAKALLAAIDSYLGQGAAEMPPDLAAGEGELLQPFLTLARARTAPTDDAATTYRELLERYPSWPLPMRDIAAIAADAEGDVDDATLRLAAKARELMPWDGVAVRSHAILLARKGRASEAMPLLRSVVATSPGDGVAHYWLAEALLSAGDKPGAQSSAADALAAGLPAALAESAHGIVGTREVEAP